MSSTCERGCTPPSQAAGQLLGIGDFDGASARTRRTPARLRRGLHRPAWEGRHVASARARAGTRVISHFRSRTLADPPAAVRIRRAPARHRDRPVSVRSGLVGAARERQGAVHPGRLAQARSGRFPDPASAVEQPRDESTSAWCRSQCPERTWGARHGNRWPIASESSPHKGAHARTPGPSTGLEWPSPEVGTGPTAESCEGRDPCPIVTSCGPSAFRSSGGPDCPLESRCREPQRTGPPCHRAARAPRPLPGSSGAFPTSRGTRGVGNCGRMPGIARCRSGAAPRRRTT